VFLYFQIKMIAGSYKNNGYLHLYLRTQPKKVSCLTEWNFGMVAVGSALNFFFSFLPTYLLHARFLFQKSLFQPYFIYIDGKVCALLYPFAYCCMISCNLNIASYSNSVYCWMKLPVFLVQNWSYWCLIQYILNLMFCLLAVHQMIHGVLIKDSPSILLLHVLLIASFFSTKLILLVFNTIHIQSHVLFAGCTWDDPRSPYQR
jgi:hypothetical protein